MPNNNEQKTAALFGDLWYRYDDKLFEESVALFGQRFAANGFDLEWFQGKKCLDVGCGGGRYSIAMAKLGAGQVVGVDISPDGLEDARQRAAGLENLRFEETSALELPFDEASFDFVCCSGVLHHTSDPEKGLQELSRVLRPGGKVFLLIYGQGGMRWPTIMQIRPHAQTIGYDLMDRAMRIAELPANKQRTFLDDFFVPIIQFYGWDQLQSLLTENGFEQIDRWTKGKLDHESSVEVQKKELEMLLALFESITTQSETDPEYAPFAVNVKEVTQDITSRLKSLDQVESAFAAGEITGEERRREIFGWGHHRVLAVKK